MPDHTFDGSLTSLMSSMGISGEVIGVLTNNPGGFRTVGSTVISVDTQGVTALERALDELPGNVAKGVLVDAVNAGGKMFQAAAIALAPYDDYSATVRSKTHLKDGIKTQSTVKQKGVTGTDVSCKVGLIKAVFYGRFIEDGWNHVGGHAIPAHPFMRPAFEGTKYPALNVILTLVAAGIEAEAMKLHR